MSLIARHLAKRYQQKTVVENASFEVPQGHVVGLLGPNGAGKTTSFYMVMGLVEADGGEVLLDGNNITPLPMHRRARLGITYLPQEASIFRNLTVRENIIAILELTTSLNKAKRFERADELMAELSITHKADTLGIALSGGERRRCELARALATNPRYILLDEPFAGVDPLAVHEIRSLIEQLTLKNIGILITDHNVRETLKSCHHAYILSNGRVMAEGTPEQIVRNPLAIQHYLGHDFSLH
ncbi:MAG: LPS export ABC transporter ATP-binding protein [Cardiobacteriaceae bacterium]|nr:LPS export ABC transporter ATP-binding protein [Cardiobacteriaceae bacterium]